MLCVGRGNLLCGAVLGVAILAGGCHSDKPPPAPSDPSARVLHGDPRNATGRVTFGDLPAAVGESYTRTTRGRRSPTPASPPARGAGMYPSFTRRTESPLRRPTAPTAAASTPTPPTRLTHPEVPPPTNTGPVVVPGTVPSRP